MSPRLSEKNKPDIFLLDSKDREIAHYFTQIKKDEAKSELIDLISCIYEIVEKHQFNKENSEVITRMIASKYKMIYEMAGRRLVQLSHYFEMAENLLLSLSKSKKSNIRLRIIQSIWTEAPKRSVMLEIIENGLKDNNSNVRIFSAERAVLWDTIELFSDFEIAINSEKDLKVLKNLEINYNLLLHGYYLDINDVIENEIGLIIKTEKGILFRRIKSEQNNETIIRKIVEELKNENKRRR
jgi:hypothetical protein